jgi:hypothetical protein
MKKTQFILTTTLIATIIIGAIADSADARRGRGRRAIGSRTNNFDVKYNFDLYTGNDTQDPIIPTNKLVGGINLYTFNDALTNFDTTFTDTDQDEFNFVEEIVKDSPLNLNARYLPSGETITLPDGSTVLSSDNDFGIPTNSILTTDRIEYVITDSSLDNVGIKELTLFIEDTNTVNLLNTPEERNKAITDIEYIVDNGLLRLINGVRVSGKSKANPNKIVSTESSGEQISFAPITSSVPESNNVISLLGLGCLGMSLLVKKKVTHL